MGSRWLYLVCLCNFGWVYRPNITGRLRPSEVYAAAATRLPEKSQEGRATGVSSPGRLPRSELHDFRAFG